MQSQMTVVEGSGGQLRCCDRWRKSFDKEQRRAKVSKIWRKGNKKIKKLSPLAGEKQLGGSMNGN